MQQELTASQSLISLLRADIESKGKDDNRLNQAKAEIKELYELMVTCTAQKDEAERERQ